jgi:tetratricopeptide (TPR) repeat protein
MFERVTSPGSRACALTVWLMVVWFLAGCASAPAGGRWVRTGDAIVDGKAAIEQGPRRDRVLWQYRTAVAAMRLGRFDEARSLLDEALAMLGGIHGPDREARRARGYFSPEARKGFLGEPYERVMAYYYRGVLYWMDGEIDNARACFRSAQFMDSDAENQEYANDYVLLEYLDGFATVKLGGDGSDALARAKSLARLDEPPDYEVGANLLFFVEFGKGPKKYSAGRYGEQLRFLAGSSKVKAVRIRWENRVVEARPFDDLTFQATTRGGRVMDHVLANKAVFKQATDDAGTGAIIAGAIMAGQRGHDSPVDEIGAGLMVAGVLSKVLSAATTPAADTRTWDNLPQYLSFSRLTVPEGDYELEFEFMGEGGNPIADRTQRVWVRVEAGRDTVVFVSDNNP